MKLLRCALYVERGVPPMHTIMREVDTTVSLEEASKEMINFPYGFVYTDYYEMPGEPDILAASLEGEKRYNENKEREHNMALTWIWYAGVLEKLNPGGLTSMTQPAPLSADDLEFVLKQLPKHPLYKDQTVITIARDESRVVLKGRVVHRE